MTLMADIVIDMIFMGKKRIKTQTVYCIDIDDDSGDYLITTSCS